MSLNKKRKASVLEEDATPVKYGQKSPSSDRVMKKDEGMKLPDDYYDRPDPLIVECPAHPKKRKSSAGDDVFGPEHESAGFANLDITYAVRPGSAWSSLKPYRNFIGEHVLSTLFIANLLICTVGEQKFSLGSIVYINRHSPAPPAPPPGSSEATILEYDRANLWVAKVLEVRAKDTQHVYLRLFWLYWPDELPNKRQPYHGANELIMSNAMDIVDAMTVAGPAEVTHWDEYKDEQEDLGQRFFRQFLDIKKLGKGIELSPLRRHCICHEYYNPDKTMYKCPSEDCGMWNHEECLVEAILDKTYKKLVEESGPAANGTETNVLSTVKDAVAKPLFPAEKLKDLGKSQTPSNPAVKNEPVTPKLFSKAKKKVNGANRRNGMFKASITNGDETVGKAVKVTIKDERGQDPETWVEDVKCLKCGQILD
jgi:hypothetical protein